MLQAQAHSYSFAHAIPVALNAFSFFILPAQFLIIVLLVVILEVCFLLLLGFLFACSLF